MNRLRKKLDHLLSIKEKALVAYLVAGDPDLDSTLDLMHLFGFFNPNGKASKK